MSKAPSSVVQSAVVETELEKLRPAEYNPQKISDVDRAKLEQSILADGILENLVVNKDGTIISGHKRFDAAKKLKMNTVPCRFVDVPKNKEKVLNIALNKIRGTFDMALLPELIESLPEELVSLTGFSDEEVQAMLGDFEPASEEEAGGGLDERTPVECPECGHKFVP